MYIQLSNKQKPIEINILLKVLIKLYILIQIFGMFLTWPISWLNYQNSVKNVIDGHLVLIAC